MKSFDTELKKYTEKVRMTMHERHELRERILSYMEYHPLPKKHESLVGADRFESQPFIVVHLSALYKPLYARIGAGVLAVLFVVGIPFLAEQSVPGDVLYLVKTGINENVQSKFAGSPYEKVAFERNIIERRIAEARLLASEGKLTTDVQQQIAATVKDHATAAQNSLAQLRSSNPDAAAIAAITLDSSLQVQSAVLAPTSGSTTNATSSTNDILQAVNSARDEISSNLGNTTASYEGLSAQIEQETTRAYELFDTVKQTATADEVADIERRLSDINAQVKVARDAYGNGDAQANQDLVDSLGLIQKLVSFMTDIGVRQTVSIDTLVPVQPTLDERIATVHETLARIEASTTRITGGLSSTTDPDVKGKVKEHLSQITELMNTATSSLGADPVAIDAAEESLGKAEAFITNIETLLLRASSGNDTNTGTTTENRNGTSTQGTGPQPTTSTESGAVTSPQTSLHSGGVPPETHGVS